MAKRLPRGTSEAVTSVWQLLPQGAMLKVYSNVTWAVKWDVKPQVSPSRGSRWQSGNTLTSHL